MPQFFPFAFLFGVMGPSSNTLNFKWVFHPINVSGVFSASWPAIHWATAQVSDTAAEQKPMKAFLT